VSETVDTGQIAELLQVSRRHVTDKLSKSPDFPPPVINLSERIRRWDLAAVLAYARQDSRQSRPA
jgi:predicted DNA-binding transcriptional regulator AlpA